MGARTIEPTLDVQGDLDPMNRILQPYAFAAGGSGPSFLIDEDFEGTGTPSGWGTTGSGTANFDSTTSPLEGAQSLRLTGTTNIISTTLTIQEPELWWKFRYKPASLPSVTLRIPLIYDSAFNEIAKIILHTTGQLIVDGGGIFELTTDSLSAGTEYWITGHYKKGSGANAVLECGFSTTDTRPSSGSKYAGATNGTQTANTDLVLLGSGNIVADFDVVQIATTTF